MRRTSVWSQRALTACAAATSAALSSCTPSKSSDTSPLSSTFPDDAFGAGLVGDCCLVSFAACGAGSAGLAAPSGGGAGASAGCTLGCLARLGAAAAAARFGGMLR